MDSETSFNAGRIKTRELGAGLWWGVCEANHYCIPSSIMTFENLFDFHSCCNCPHLIGIHMGIVVFTLPFQCVQNVLESSVLSVRIWDDKWICLVLVMAKVVGQLLPYGVWRSAMSIIRVHWAPSSKTQTRTLEMTWTNQEKTSMAHCTPLSSASQWLSSSASVMCWRCFFFFNQKHVFVESMHVHSKKLMGKCSRYRFRLPCRLFFAWNLLQRSVNLFLAVMVDLCVVRGQWKTDSELNVAKPLSI